MPDAYTYIPKPTDSNWTTINPQGKQTYDESDITYDDPTVFYDSYDPNAYTFVSKPSLTVIRAGYGNPLLIPLTNVSSVMSDQWTLISKPTQ